MTLAKESSLHHVSIMGPENVLTIMSVTMAIAQGQYTEVAPDRSLFVIMFLAPVQTSGSTLCPLHCWDTDRTSSVLLVIVLTVQVAPGNVVTSYRFPFALVHPSKTIISGTGITIATFMKDKRFGDNTSSKVYS